MPLVISLVVFACAPPTPALLLGTGEAEFQPIEEGDNIEVVRGPQGGYHILASLRAVSLNAGDRDNLSSPENPTVRFEGVWNGQSIIPNASYTQGLDLIVDPTDDWTHEMVGRLAIIDLADDSIPIEEVDDTLTGSEIVFSVSLTEAGGQVYTDSRTLIMVPHPANW